MNSKRGAVTFEVDGQPYTLRMTTNAMVRYEDRSGESIVEALGKMDGANVSISSVRRLFWTMLVGDLSEEQAGDLMDEIGLTEAAAKLGEAARLAFPQAQPSGNAPKPSETPPTS